ncbi:MAG: DUF4330 domain-containing protein [bacterium]
MIKNGKLFGHINLIDLSIIFVVLLAVTGLTLVKTGRFTTSAQIIKEKSTIEFDVVIRGQKLSKQSALFKPGEKTFITIRNVPYTALEVVKSEITPWQTVIPNPKDLSKALAVDDPTAPHTYNFFVTLKDKALITNDGPVIGGNKIKIGLVVSLEGFDYRLSGIVSGVRIIKDK